ncbi:MAG TPA: AbrB/MazE/SpoVT family DNA-binding domain-containing protein [Gemmatimonadaceae bacterium]|nr:AbrB/MazE/SpoVT family DNA-binding domain-containing protein [Gemmatimonadaceae bacterium]
MRVKETVVRAVGNSAGVTLPKDMLDKYAIAKGDTVALRETDEGILITPFDPDFAAVMEKAHEVSKKYRNALRELSKG